MQFWVRSMQNNGSPTFCLLQGSLTIKHSYGLQTFVGKSYAIKLQICDDQLGLILQNFIQQDVNYFFFVNHLVLSACYYYVIKFLKFYYVEFF